MRIESSTKEDSILMLGGQTLGRQLISATAFFLDSVPLEGRRLSD